MVTRRGASLLLVALAALLLAVSYAPTVQAAVMGIDFGSEFIKVASVKPGTPFHIVVDEQSKRKIPSVVAFDNGERHFGNGAVQLAMRKPKDTYLWAHRLLGKDIHAPQVAALKEQGFPWEIIELPDRKSIGFKHADGVIFSVEEVVAMNLQHIMKIAEADAESPVRDAVLTVPDYWTHRERMALVDAAEIAGINVLSLVNENTAAAIQYGIDRKYNASDASHTIAIYNMGSTSTKVSVAHFSAFVKKDSGRLGNKGGNRTVGQVEMLSVGFDDTLGGHAFEMKVADWIATEVNRQLATKAPAGKTAYDIRSNMKAMAKIRSAAEKAKVVLSANQESQIFLNSLHDDMDFKMMLTREEFYSLCADLLARVTAPLAQALRDADLQADDVEAVVIIGGGVRIPAVQAALKAFSGKETLGQNLNGDEAAVMGAVFRAANLSTTFQVRPFGLIEQTPYAVGVRITNKDNAAAVATPAAAATTVEEVAAPVAESDDEASAASSSTSAATPATPGAFSKRASLFKRHNRVGKKKTVQFTHTADFVAALSHEAPGDKGTPLPTGIPLPIDVYNVTGLDRLMSSDKYARLLADGTQRPRVALSFMLDQSGLVSLLRAEATLEEMVKVLKPKPKAPKLNATGVDEANSTATVNVTAAADANATEADAAAAAEGATPAAADATAEETKDAAAAEGEASEEKKAESAAAGVEGEAAGEGEKNGTSAEADGEPEYTLKKKVHTVALTVTYAGSPSSIAPLNATHKVQSKAALEKLRRADDLKKEIAAAKNTLEAHIYATRTQLGEEHVEAVSSEEQRETGLAALAAAEDWLYEQADDSASIFHAKLAELRKLSDPILFRVAEVTALPLALNYTKTLLAFVGKQVKEYPTSRAWVPEAELKKLQSSLEDITDWLAEQQEAQAKLAAHEVAVLDSEALYERTQPLHKLSDALSKLKKPIEKAPKIKVKTPSGADKKGAKADAKPSAADDAEANTTSGSTAEADATSSDKQQEEQAEPTAASTEEQAEQTPEQSEANTAAATPEGEDARDEL